MIKKKKKSDVCKVKRISTSFWSHYYAKPIVVLEVTALLLFSYELYVILIRAHTL